MNATEFERELNKLTEDLAEKYIKLRDLERAGYKDEINGYAILWTRCSC
mgnify:CR=1 FL=1